MRSTMCYRICFKIILYATLASLVNGWPLKANNDTLNETEHGVNVDDINLGETYRLTQNAENLTNNEVETDASKGDIEQTDFLHQNILANESFVTQGTEVSNAVGAGENQNGNIIENQTEVHQTVESQVEAHQVLSNDGDQAAVEPATEPNQANIEQPNVLIQPTELVVEQVQVVENVEAIEPIQAPSTTQSISEVVKVVDDVAIVDSTQAPIEVHQEIIENHVENMNPGNIPISDVKTVVETTTKSVVRFDSKGDSIEHNKHHEENCQAKEDSNEMKTSTKKRKVKSKSSVETTAKTVVRFDSKGNSIDDDDHHEENCQVEETSDEKKASTKKTRRNRGGQNLEEEQIDSENEASDGEREESHESDEDDGIPVITIPLGDILRKYARLVDGHHSDESEMDDRFIINGHHHDHKKEKTLMEL